MSQPTQPTQQTEPQQTYNNDSLFIGAISYNIMRHTPGELLPPLYCGIRNNQALHHQSPTTLSPTTQSHQLPQKSDHASSSL